MFTPSIRASIGPEKYRSSPCFSSTSLRRGSKVSWRLVWCGRERGEPRSLVVKRASAFPAPFGVSSSTSGVEKKTREYEDNADLQALVAGISPSNPNRQAYLFDNVDIPAMINYATAGIISQDFDRWAKNFFVYRDTNGSGEWLQIPHDKDLTFGKYFFDDQITGSGFALSGSAFDISNAGARAMNVWYPS